MRQNVHRDETPISEPTISDYMMDGILRGIYPPNDYKFLNDEALVRFKNVNAYYDYYDLDGQYWSYPGKLDYRPTVMPVNMARYFVDKRASWMFEIAPDVECPPEQYDDPEQMEDTSYEPSRKQKTLNKRASTREQFLYSVYDSNSMSEKLLEAAKDYFIGGTVGLRVHHDQKQGIRLLFIPAQEIFPFADPNDPDKLEKVHLLSFYDNDKTIWKQTWSLEGDRCYMEEGLYDTRLNLRQEIYPKSDMLLDFIPIVLVPHRRLTGQVFGTSLLKDIIPICDQYNRSISDASDALRFNLFAIKVLMNAAPDSEKNLKVAPGAVWNIQGDDVDAKQLEAHFNYAEAQNDYLKRLDNIMHLLAEVPRVTPDQLKGFGLVSGVALKLLYSDLVSSTQQAWRAWKPRLSRVNEYILRMAESYSGYEWFVGDIKSSDIDGNYTTRIIPHLPLPENEMEQIEMQTKKLAASLQSVEGAMQELGVHNPPALIAKILAERERFLNEGNQFGKLLDKEEKKLMGGL